MLTTFQELSSHMGLVASLVNSADVGHFHHHKKCCWAALAVDTRLYYSLFNVILVPLCRSTYFC